MRVETAAHRDVRHWLDLAAEVEWFFGDMLGSASFHKVLLKHVARGTAFCVRESDGPPGSPLMGGLLFSPAREDRPEYRIGWLSVAERWRRHGTGRALVEHVCGLVHPPAELSVVTFGADVPPGHPARHFYQQLGFQPAEPAPTGPEGGSRQVFRRTFTERTERRAPRGSAPSR